MRKIILKNCDFNTKKKLLQRPAINYQATENLVQKIVDDVKANGSKAAIKYSKLYDNFTDRKIFTEKEKIDKSVELVDRQYLQALETAAENIKKFHYRQLPEDFSIETSPGVNCSYKYKPIENVGIYVPGGTAILPSTILMLAIPARLAGCKRIMMITPCKGSEIDNKILAAAKIAGVTEILQIGGAQGIALAAYGDLLVEKVDKIFGPGNQYVTAAKNIVSKDITGCAIDMPAGPSEVLIIADKSASPDFVASDLLAQAEHGTDSQSILVTDDEIFANDVINQIETQLKVLSRKEIIKTALKNSFVLITSNLDEAIEFSNNYAPEHLIINCKNEEILTDKIKNAGSVFIGEYTPESAGDYASGTNHSLPTYGFAKVYSGVSIRDFQKTISFQKITKTGLRNLSETIITLAEAEKLNAHANAVKLRLR